MKRIIFSLFILLSLSLSAILSWTRQEDKNLYLLNKKETDSKQAWIKDDEQSYILPVKDIQYTDITWWDLLSKDEFDYYKIQDEKYSSDPDYMGDGSVPPTPGINPELEGMIVRIPGFTVGVDSVPGVYNEMKSFLLVPYQGACIHIPPPPPNQTIYVEMIKAVKTDPYIPVYVEGTIHIKKSENEIAPYFYQMNGLKISNYSE